ncbi:hypothetical protein PF005_g24947 [Phytophthora fragariae]|uniref:Uncharacterized protein n=1 Tax=Phytophthora fragariae TaxID=53985 RepID=A0A6A3W4U0_9STRA|nr:hypothetical protein PF003_g23237 [Phytophthora fragariae]KAE8917546.1 hypothetical protein PF009_g32133 [Phytophthora fragariae]KAE8977389.1 hypothetical protein PF011_g23670 [Phytophthora fragariae]KAE9060293.1 hypothetical protein PF006_g31677 [Phytophthora fragariae]KAE9074058.1 hypothetical protein PF010_g24834 [Phytophthora fragariae]
MKSPCFKPPLYLSFLSHPAVPVVLLASSLPLVSTVVPSASRSDIRCGVDSR